MSGKQEFVNKLQSINIDVSHEILAKLDAYEHLLIKWNKTINLVSSSTLSDIWDRHFLDSAQLVRFLTKSNSRIVDFGSGAGFPVLVYAALLQTNNILKNIEIHAIESDSRKCTFMREVVRNLGLNVTLHNSRIEQINIGFFDFITARALASLSDLLTYAHPFIKKESTCLFLKGETVDKEIEALSRFWQCDITKVPSISADSGQAIILKNIKLV